MGRCVVDASAAMALLAPNQSSDAARAFAASLPVGLAAPAVFSVEVRHALLRLERRQVLRTRERDSALMDLEGLLALAPAPAPLDLVRITGLARDEGLGMYDALYLDLALEQGAQLASRDSALLAAALRRGVEVVDLR